MRHVARLSLTLVVPCLSLAVWWLITALHLISPLYLPAPSEVVTAYHDAAPEIAAAVLWTLMRLVLGFLTGLALGYLIGALMVVSKTFHAFVGPIVDSGRTAPMAASLPFFLLWFGFSVYGQILFTTVGVALIVGSSVVDAARAVPPHLIRVAQTFGATRLQLIRLVIMPGLLPQLAPTLRICLGVAGSLAVTSEFMGADHGIGVQMELARRTLKTESLVLFSLVLAIVVLLCDAVLRAYLGHRMRWMPTRSEAMDKRQATPNLRRQKTT